MRSKKNLMKFCVLFSFFSLFCVNVNVRAELSNSSADLKQNIESINIFIKDALKIIKTKNENTALNELKSLVEARFAVSEIAKFILGRNAKLKFNENLIDKSASRLELSIDESKKFLDCLTNMLVKSYYNTIKNIVKDQTINYEKKIQFKLLNQNGSRYTVSSNLINLGLNNILNWNIKEINGEMKFFDVIYDNISMIRMQKTEFQNSIEKANGNIKQVLKDFFNKYSNENWINN